MARISSIRGSSTRHTWQRSSSGIVTCCVLAATAAFLPSAVVHAEQLVDFTPAMTPVSPAYTPAMMTPAMLSPVSPAYTPSMVAPSMGVSPVLEVPVTLTPVTLVPQMDTTERQEDEKVPVVGDAATHTEKPSATEVEDALVVAPVVITNPEATAARFTTAPIEAMSVAPPIEPPLAHVVVMNPEATAVPFTAAPIEATPVAARIEPPIAPMIPVTRAPTGASDSSNTDEDSTRASTGSDIADITTAAPIAFVLSPVMTPISPAYTPSTIFVSPAYTPTVSVSVAQPFLSPVDPAVAMAPVRSSPVFNPVASPIQQPVEEPTISSAPVSVAPVATDKTTATPVTLAPVSTDGTTTAPIISDRVTSASGIGAPVSIDAGMTAAPGTSAPMLTDGETATPGTAAPISAETSSSAPVTTAPVSSDGTTDAPVISAPVSADGATAAPVVDTPIELTNGPVVGNVDDMVDTPNATNETLVPTTAMPVTNSPISFSNVKDTPLAPSNNILDIGADSILSMAPSALPLPCQDEDHLDFWVEFEGTTKSCLWLRQQVSFPDTFCSKNGVPHYVCKGTCKTCDVVDKVHDEQIAEMFISY